MHTFAGMTSQQDGQMFSRSYAPVEVPVGDLILGGTKPILLQSMATCNTMDTAASVDQAVRLFDAGCALVRFTAPGLREAENLKNIRSQLNKMGYRRPLIADIHYTPSAAVVAARYVEKVRINPGNYTEKKKFDLRRFSPDEQQQALERIRDKLLPLIHACREEGTAIRIGTNHGSLSDRIMSLYGDTPDGMVMSALEFVEICEQEGFDDIVLSMKSSNPVVMVAANRLLVDKMRHRHKGYPLHLGVTEAGDGTEGRLKSAVGIGALVAEGIGDTVRVSLTEDPWHEIPVARDIVTYGRRAAEGFIRERGSPAANQGRFQRMTSPCRNIGATHLPVVMAEMILAHEIRKNDFEPIGYRYHQDQDKWTANPFSADYVYCHKTIVDFQPPPALGLIYDFDCWVGNRSGETSFPMISKQDLTKDTLSKLHPELNFIYIMADDVDDEFAEKLSQLSNAVLVLDTQTEPSLSDQRLLFEKLRESNIHLPVILAAAFDLPESPANNIKAGIDTGSILLDGLGDGVFFKTKAEASLSAAMHCAFGILHAARRRISKTDYISCPSCGRTLFDLQETTARIKKVTSHLKGLKIGIMGCIVNGPGEMADADYGYVGTGPGKITLYKGQEIVQRNIPEQLAVEALIQLIKDNNDWVEQQS